MTTGERLMDAKDRARLRDLISLVADEKRTFVTGKQVRALLDTADERDRLAVRVAELEAALRELRGQHVADPAAVMEMYDFDDDAWAADMEAALRKADALLATPAAAPTTRPPDERDKEEVR